ncbi:MAG TPA: DNA polymerase III subunit delta [Phycisphaerales bacterium]|nr:DNA polymerase III subunit delta [Phycisphaerales bacterium]HMP36062.1 DNA polymerase III subunit delta [Phycisphaerales bacterium]
MARTARAGSPPPTTLDASLRVVVLAGPEPFLATERLAELVAALRERHGDVSRFAYEGESSSLSAADVLDELRSFGLMDAHKLVVVSEADRFLARDSNRALFESYCQNPMEEATLVLRAAKWNRGRLDGLIERVGRIVRCDPPERGEEAVAWATQRARDALGRRLSKAAAELLVIRCGLELGRLDMEIQKLATFAGEGREIDVEHVEALTAPTREEVFWKVQAPLMAGDAVATLTAIDELYDRTPPSRLDVPLAFSIVDAVRKLQGGAALLRDGAQLREVAAAVGIWGSEQRAMLAAIERASTLPPERLAGLLDDAVAAELRTRGAAFDARMALEAFVVKAARILAPERRRPASSAALAHASVR